MHHKVGIAAGRVKEIVSHDVELMIIGLQRNEQSDESGIIGSNDWKHR